MVTFDLRQYRGEIKIHNPESGRAVIVKVERLPNNSRFAPGRIMLSVLVKHDPKAWRAWRGFAFVDSAHGALVWKSKSGRFYGSLAMLLNDPEIGEARGYTYHLQ
jgi:hypothetical protein